MPHLYSFSDLPPIFSRFTIYHTLLHLGFYHSGRSQNKQGNPRRDNHLAEIELKILRLGEDTHLLPLSTAYSPSSPTRAKSSVERQDIYGFEHYLNDADGESDADFEEPLPKKRRRSNRRMARVKARKAALEELNGRRMLRTAREPTRDHAGSINAYRKTQKPEKNKCRLPDGKLFTLSKRPGNLDAEITYSEFPMSRVNWSLILL